MNRWLPRNKQMEGKQSLEKSQKQTSADIMQRWQAKKQNREKEKDRRHAKPVVKSAARMQNWRCHKQNSEQERVKEQGWKYTRRGTDMDLMEKECARNRDSKEWLHADSEIFDMERQRQREHVAGKNLGEAIALFLKLCDEGPVYVCTSCLQLNFLDDVSDVSRLHQGYTCNCLKSVKQRQKHRVLWLCNTCKRDISQDMIPKLSSMNKVGFPHHPDVLCLHPLEETLIVPLLPFMTVCS